MNVVESVPGPGSQSVVDGVPATARAFDNFRTKFGGCERRRSDKSAGLPGFVSRIFRWRRQCGWQRAGCGHWCGWWRAGCGRRCGWWRAGLGWEKLVEELVDFIEDGVDARADLVGIEEADGPPDGAAVLWDELSCMF